MDRPNLSMIETSAARHLRFSETKRFSESWEIAEYEPWPGGFRLRAHVFLPRDLFYVAV